MASLKIDLPGPFAVQVMKDVKGIESSGCVYPISGSVFSIGRKENQDLIISRDIVSREHAVIKINENGDEALIENLSSNGFKLNGKEYSHKGDRVVLNNNDLIIIGGRKVKFLSAITKENKSVAKKGGKKGRGPIKKVANDESQEEIDQSQVTVQLPLLVYRKNEGSVESTETPTRRRTVKNSEENIVTVKSSKKKSMKNSISNKTSQPIMEDEEVAVNRKRKGSAITSPQSEKKSRSEAESEIEPCPFEFSLTDEKEVISPSKSIPEKDKSDPFTFDLDDKKDQKKKSGRRWKTQPNRTFDEISSELVLKRLKECKDELTATSSKLNVAKGIINMLKTDVFGQYDLTTIGTVSVLTEKVFNRLDEMIVGVGNFLKEKNGDGHTENITKDVLEKKNQGELRKLCGRLNLKMGGLKTELVKRLLGEINKESMSLAESVDEVDKKKAKKDKAKKEKKLIQTVETPSTTKRSRSSNDSSEEADV